MKQNEKKIYSGWESLNSNQVETPIRLKINPIPPVFVTLIVFGVLYGCYFAVEISAIYLQKFTDFLLIPKVLNLPILQDQRLYIAAGVIIFGYIGLGFILDWIRFIGRTCFTVLFLKGDFLFLERKFFFDKNVFQWNRKQNGIQVIHKTGLLRGFLGLERIVIVSPDFKTLYSPFFFPSQNGNLIRGLFEY
ncbi:LIC20162 family protein [Leptospira interrogans serovar Copenhageni]|uniref:LIC20162 family protein n=1 Tax=Leptospira interrogans TaxID=173 RepID=UPI003CEE047C